MNKSEFILTLLKLPKIGKKTARKVYENIYCLDVRISDIFEYFKELTNFKFEFDQIEDANYKAQKLIDECKSKDIGITCFDDENFPVKLLELRDAPVLLFYKGNIKRLNLYPSIAIIGSREPSNYGKEIAKKYSDYFVKRGFNIVSGLAKGIDSIGHSVTVNLNGYATAFIAQGLDTPIYPKESRELAKEILFQSGVIISEYEPSIKPKPSYFVERDRLQCGTSDAVLVIETDVNGGSMHAANGAIELGRICAVLNHPEKFKTNNSKSRGNEMLIKDKSAMAVFDLDSLNRLSERIQHSHDLFIKNLSDKKVIQKDSNFNSKSSTDNEQMKFDV